MIRLLPLGLLSSLFAVTCHLRAELIEQVPVNSELKEPFGCDFDKAGHLWIIEMISGNRLFEINTDGAATLRTGQLEPGFSGDNGPALTAKFNGPHSIVITHAGKILIADTWNGVVREFDPDKQFVRTLPGYRAPKGKERAHGPYCITLSPDGATLHIADLKQVIALDLASNIAKVVAGNGEKGVPKDGDLAIHAPLVDPRAAAMDSKGNLYILERNGHALRVVDPAGRIRTVVNASGKKGAYGDGGPAIEATMNGPKHLCIDRDDSVLIADAENHLIRRYLPITGKIERVAGSGKKGSNGVGSDPKSCELARPHGVTIEPSTGNLFITDTYNHRILRIPRH